MREINVYSKPPGGKKMEATTGTNPLVWVKDRAGKEFLCPVKSLRNPGDVTEEERKHCFESAEVYFDRGG